MARQNSKIKNLLKRIDDLNNKVQEINDKFNNEIASQGKKSRWLFIIKIIFYLLLILIPVSVLVIGDKFISEVKIKAISNLFLLVVLMVSVLMVISNIGVFNGGERGEKKTDILSFIVGLISAVGSFTATMNSNDGNSFPLYPFVVNPPQVSRDLSDLRKQIVKLDEDVANGIKSDSIELKRINCSISKIEEHGNQINQKLNKFQNKLMLDSSITSGTPQFVLHIPNNGDSSNQFGAPIIFNLPAYSPPQNDSSNDERLERIIEAHENVMYSMIRKLDQISNREVVVDTVKVIEKTDTLTILYQDTAHLDTLFEQFVREQDSVVLDSIGRVTYHIDSAITLQKERDEQYYNEIKNKLSKQTKRMVKKEIRDSKKDIIKKLEKQFKKEEAKRNVAGVAARKDPHNYLLNYFPKVSKENVFPVPYKMDNAFFQFFFYPDSSIVINAIKCKQVSENISALKGFSSNASLDLDSLTYLPAQKSEKGLVFPMFGLPDTTIHIFRTPNNTSDILLYRKKTDDNQLFFIHDLSQNWGGLHKEEKYSIDSVETFSIPMNRELNTKAINIDKSLNICLISNGSDLEGIIEGEFVIKHNENLDNSSEKYKDYLKILNDSNYTDLALSPDKISNRINLFDVEGVHNLIIETKQKKQYLFKLSKSKRRGKVTIKTIVP